MMFLPNARRAFQAFGGKYRRQRSKNPTDYFHQNDESFLCMRTPPPGVRKVTRSGGGVPGERLSRRLTAGMGAKAAGLLTWCGSSRRQVSARQVTYSVQAF